MKEILIADDESLMRKSMRALFEGEGYAVRTARDGADALAKFAERRPDLLLLDVMMPVKNGIAVCSEIRRTDPLLPILFFTAMPSEAGLVRGLGLGADDYIDKARSSEELLARVAAALRRVAAAASASDDSDVVRLGSVTADLARMSVTGSGESVPLTKSETQFLRLLASERGRVFSADEIFSALRGEGYVGDDGALHSVVHRLKLKLGNGGALIESVRGAGYRLMR